MIESYKVTYCTLLVITIVNLSPVLRSYPGSFSGNDAIRLVRLRIAFGR